MSGTDKCKQCRDYVNRAVKRGPEPVEKWECASDIGDSERYDCFKPRRTEEWKPGDPAVYLDERG